MSLSNVIDTLISRQKWDWLACNANGLEPEEKHQMWFDHIIKYHVKYMKKQLRNRDNIMENEWKVGFYNNFNRYVRMHHDVVLDKHKLYYSYSERIGDDTEPVLYVK